MNRRDLIALLGSTAAAWPLGARAETSEKLPLIGIIGATTRTAQGQWWATFVERLRELGWVEGRTVVVEQRWGEGRNERYREIAAEFVRLKANLIVTTAPVVPAVKQVTSTIPIIFALSGDPVGTGLIASLARPGGNATGLSMQQTDLATKRLEIVRELVPGLRRLAVMGNVQFPDAVLEMQTLEHTAKTLGLEIVRFDIRNGDDIAPAFQELRGRADALDVASDPLLFANRVRINTLALDARVPTMHDFREYVEVGGLVSYGPNNAHLFRRAAEYADKILHGANPADLPVEQPTKFDLVVNLTTAKVLGLAVSEAFLLRADAVIE